jgi:hypothetical protein
MLKLSQTAAVVAGANKQALGLSAADSVLGFHCLG